MQNEKQTAPSWVTDLWEAYGAEGIVAMAWWTGAMYADQVRERMGSFPLLNISGSEDSGKSALLFALSRISGDQEYALFNPERCNRAGMLIAMSERVNRVSIMAIEDADRCLNGIIEQDLKEMYGGGTLLLIPRPEAVEVRFRGAMAISTERRSLSAPLRLRAIEISMNGANHTEQSLNAQWRLMQPQDQHAEQFLARVEAFREQAAQTIDCLGRQHAAALIKRDIAADSYRNAANHGQLAAMVDLLGQLIGLPRTIIKAAQQEVINMFDFRSLPF